MFFFSSQPCGRLADRGQSYSEECDDEEKRSHGDRMGAKPTGRSPYVVSTENQCAETEKDEDSPEERAERKEKRVGEDQSTDNKIQRGVAS